MFNNAVIWTLSGTDFKYRERRALYEALGLTELTDDKAPLLSEILRLSKVTSSLPTFLSLSQI